MYHHYSRFHKRDDSGGKLSTSTIIIIAVVCGCVVVLVCSLFLFRLIFRICRPRESAPLPPVQPLAHHREQQLTSLSERKSTRPPTFFESDTLLPRPYSRHISNPSSSAASLLPDVSELPSRQSSYHPEDGVSGEDSSAPSPVSFDSPLHIPTTQFSSGFNGEGSVASSEEPGDATPPPLSMSPSPSAPVSEASSMNMSYPISTRSYNNSPSRSSPLRTSTRSPSRHHTRPMSIVSSASIRTMQSRSTLRGLPHSPYSNIQVVLPAPLAPELYPYSQEMQGRYTFSSTEGTSVDRNTVFSDRWVPVGLQSMSVENLTRARSSSVGPLPGPRATPPRSRSGSLFNPSPSPSPARGSRRAASQSRMDSSRAFSPSQLSSHDGHPPPVPRIPSMYNTMASPVLEEADEPERGRSRRAVSIPVVLPDVLEAPPPPPPPPKLQKQPSRSQSRSGKLRKPRDSPQMP
ncbi:hypothetical protein OBBRIDRAFT_13315 [Obba rivulosa]|uniref:Uncharacterized protein n=1 Tax=Obba rivulosa TaxID=1052685 RepID=A0A8E2DVF1_9APHY|nr:hypothetical protein OBBRIDRAFT_13315 [Obba rivulosa]